MSAQSIWKESYSTFHYRYALPRARKAARLIMRDYRREAALERKLSAAERINDSLRYLIAENLTIIMELRRSEYALQNEVVELEERIQEMRDTFKLGFRS